MEKIKKTMYIAIFVSMASQLKFNFGNGFIIAMSVLVMAIFIYCYDDPSPKYITLCCAAFSPAMRIVFECLRGEDFGWAMAQGIPDLAFFIAYGFFYTLIYKYIIRQPKNIRNFAYVIFACDFLSNITEILTRSFLYGKFLISADIFVLIFFVALVRTVLIQVIVVAIETHSNLLLKEEHDNEYRKLLRQASVFASELHMMEKNVAEIEEIMRQAFALYKAMENIEAPKELKDSSLDISKNAHEIKGDYLNIISVLKDTSVEGIEEGRFRMRDIVAIEKSNLSSTIKARGYRAEFSTKIKADFYVKQYFKMMSIVRNLVLNSAEAIGTAGGKITLTVKAEDEDYIILVRDTGPGISPKQIETIFFDGYSTKFNMETGNVQRGLGLTLVKDYVENFFNGTITVESEKDKYTEFTIRIPKSCFEEVEDEVLHRG